MRCSSSTQRGIKNEKTTQCHWSGILLTATVAATSFMNVNSYPTTGFCSSDNFQTTSSFGCASSSVLHAGPLSPNKPLHVSSPSRILTRSLYKPSSKPLRMGRNHPDNWENSDVSRTIYSKVEFDDNFPSNILNNNFQSSNQSGDLFGETELMKDIPWILTDSQIKGMKLTELRQACVARNLIKTGNKEELQNRLVEWASDKEARKKALEQAGIVDYRVLPLQTHRMKENPGKKRLDRLSNLLASLKSSSDTSSGLLTGTDDEEDDEDEFNFQNATSTDEYLGLLTRTYHTSPHTPYSNLQLTQMYNDAKKADIDGDITTAKRILVQLSEITPHDGRIVRRLARLHSSRGDYNSARAILQKACGSYPANPHLWHGLAQIEMKTNRAGLARKYFAEAISADPEFANAYHALGRLEHKDGNIREALSILKKGIKHCPQNHRLYHALGSLYLDAKMIKSAEEVFKKGMKCGPNWSQSFFYTSLAHVAYEMEGVDKAAEWLRKSVTLNPMHAQGWSALGELEESEQNFDEARKVYIEAVDKYEEVRLKRKKNMRQGDKWRSVYMNWAKMEERIGNMSAAGEVYVRAAKVFPRDWNILTTFAIAMTKKNGRLSHSGVKSIFERSCKIVGSRHANPYRLYANYEITLSNHARARAIFFLGAEAVYGSITEIDAQNKGLAALFYDWGRLENEQMRNPNRARVLFDEALRLASPDSTDLRSKILYSIGDIEYKARNFYVAKHYACLSINESEINGSKDAWKLWANVAKQLGQKTLEETFRSQAKIQGMKEMKLWIDEDSLTPSKLLRDSKLKQMLGKTPWNRKLVYDLM